MPTDRSLTLLRRGYRFGPGLRGSRPAVETRVAGRRAVLVGGEAGAAVFYDLELTRRDGAVPRPTSDALFGRGAVHGLDDELHAARKGMFLRLLTWDAVRDVRARAGASWDAELAALRPGAPRAVQPLAAVVLGRAVLDWAGVPGTPEEQARRAHDLWQVVDGFGSLGPRYARARLARRRTEQLLRDAVREL
ncbi:cytochrome P450 family protein, partial [Angustibacter aerolatus]